MGDTRNLLTTSWITDTLFDTQEVLSLMFTNSLPRDRVSSPTLPPKSPLPSFDWLSKLLLSDSLLRRPEVLHPMVLQETPSWMSKSLVSTNVLLCALDLPTKSSDSTSTLSFKYSLRVQKFSGFDDIAICQSTRASVFFTVLNKVYR